jgi:hypothetical protein
VCEYEIVSGGGRFDFNFDFVSHAQMWFLSSTFPDFGAPSFYGVAGEIMQKR